MGHDVIHPAVHLIQPVHAVLHFLQGGHFPFPPFSRLDPVLLFDALPAAKGKDLFSLDGEQLSPHQMAEIRTDTVNPSPGVFLLRIAFQQVEILMDAVYKQDLVLFLLQLFQRLFLLLGAFPEEAEISADNQGIPLFDVPKRGILKAFHKAVHISRNKYHFNSSR